MCEILKLSRQRYTVNKKYLLFCIFVMVGICLIQYAVFSDLDDCSNFDKSVFRQFQVSRNSFLMNDMINLVNKNTFEPYKTGFLKLITVQHSPKNACKGDFNLLIIVKSSARNFKRRNIIRNTWGRTQNDSFRVYFTVGTVNEISGEVLSEVNTFNDIIFGNFIDSYRNNTLKTMMTYRWVHINCSNIPFVLLVDDDYYINAKRILEFIEEEIQKNGCFMYGSLVQYWHPVRQKGDPNSYITQEEYPFSCFPDYISGGSMLTCIKTIKIISSAIPYVRPFSLDDVYIGVIASLLSVPLRNETRMSIQPNVLSQSKELLTVHGVSDNNLLSYQQRS